MCKNFGLYPQRAQFEMQERSISPVVFTQIGFSSGITAESGQVPFRLSELALFEAWPEQFCVSVSLELTSLTSFRILNSYFKLSVSPISLSKK